MDKLKLFILFCNAVVRSSKGLVDAKIWRFLPDRKVIMETPSQNFMGFWKLRKVLG
jgi:hypothetical protein